MKLYTMTRPAMPLSLAACAPSALTPADAALVVAVPTVERALLPVPAVRPVAVLAAERAPAWGAHQVQIHASRVQVQAELALALVLAGGVNGTNSTTGFTGVDAAKRYTVGGSGVPPRGRPV